MKIVLNFSIETIIALLVFGLIVLMWIFILIASKVIDVKDKLKSKFKSKKKGKRDAK